MKIKIKVLTPDNEIQNILQNVYDEMNKIDIPETDFVNIFQSLGDVIEKMPEIIDEIYKDIQKEKNINDGKKHKINIDDYKNNKDLTKDKSYCKNPFYYKNPCVDEFKDVLNIDHVI